MFMQAALLLARLQSMQMIYNKMMARQIASEFHLFRDMLTAPTLSHHPMAAKV